MAVVLVIYGGRSAEHEISVLSARFIVSSLARDRYLPLLVGIAPDGRWHLQREEQLPKSADPRQARVDASGPHCWIEPMPDGGFLHIEGAPPQRFEVVFPVLHGPMGEDGTMQGLLELAAVPYVGAGVTASALGMDKVQQKKVLRAAGLEVVAHHALRSCDWSDERERERAACEALGYPLFVKPANMGSSLGVRKAGGRVELEAAVAHALELDTRVIVEEGLAGARELECSVLGNDDPEVSVPGEIVVDHPDGFYSYEAKYIDDGARLEVPAALSADDRARVQEVARRAFLAIDAAGMARVDMFLAGGKIFLNEVNTIPGFTAISMYPMLWQASGLEPGELVHRLLQLALERHALRSALRTRAHE